MPLPLPPGEGWGEGAFFSPNATSHALTPGPSPGGRGENSRLPLPEGEKCCGDHESFFAGVNLARTA